MKETKDGAKTMAPGKTHLATGANTKINPETNSNALKNTTVLSSIAVKSDAVSEAKTAPKISPKFAENTSTLSSTAGKSNAIFGVHTAPKSILESAENASTLSGIASKSTAVARAHTAIKANPETNPNGLESTAVLSSIIGKSDAVSGAKIAPKSVPRPAENTSTLSGTVGKSDAVSSAKTAPKSIPEAAENASILSGTVGKTDAVSGAETAPKSIPEAAENASTLSGTASKSTAFSRSHTAFKGNPETNPNGLKNTTVLSSIAGKNDAASGARTAPKTTPESAENTSTLSSTATDPIVDYAGETSAAANTINGAVAAQDHPATETISGAENHAAGKTCIEDKTNPADKAQPENKARPAPSTNPEAAADPAVLGGTAGETYTAAKTTAGGKGRAAKRPHAVREAIQRLLGGIAAAAFCLALPAAAAAAGERYETLDGIPTAVLTYRIAPGKDPMDLVQPDFVRAGIRYAFDHLETMPITEKDARETNRMVQVQTDTDTQAEIQDKLPDTMEVQEEDGYTGTVTLDRGTVETVPQGVHTTTTQSVVVRRYTGLASNDPSLLPGSVQDQGSTLPLTKVTWQVESEVVIGGVSFPKTWSAIATYSAMITSPKASYYLTSAVYRGTVSKEVLTGIQVSVYYSGTPVLPVPSGSPNPGDGDPQGSPPGPGAPAGTAPGESKPGESAPGTEPTPAESAPSYTAPVGTAAPGESTPGTEPSPAGSAPIYTAPVGTSPAEGTPGGNEQQGNDPGASVSGTETSPGNDPTPEQSAPVDTAPTETTPGTNPGLETPTGSGTPGNGGTVLEPDRDPPAQKGMPPAAIVGCVLLGICLISGLVYGVGKMLHYNLRVYRPVGGKDRCILTGKYRISEENTVVRLREHVPQEGSLVFALEEDMAKKLHGKEISLIADDRLATHTVGNVQGTYWFRATFGPGRESV